MQVHELLYLAEYLRDFFADKQLVAAYQQLIDAATKAASGNNPQQVGPRIERVREIHRDAIAVVLSPAQEKLLRDFGAFEVLGKKALAEFEAVLADNQAHPQGLAKALQPLKDKAEKFEQKTTTLIDPLRDMIAEEDEEKLGPDEGRLWLYFAEAAAVTTVEDLEAAAKTWKDVLHHFSRLPDADGASGRIIYIAKHSPLELEVASALVVLGPLGYGIKFVLDRIEQVIRIKQQAEELRQLKVKGEVIDMLKEDAEEKRSEIAAGGAEAVVGKFGGDNETQNAIQVGLRKIIEFIEGGGELDIDIPRILEEDESDDGDGVAKANGDVPARLELRDLIRSIRKDMKLLGSGSGEAPADVQDNESPEA